MGSWRLLVLFFSYPFNTNGIKVRPLTLPVSPGGAGLGWVVLVNGCRLTSLPLSWRVPVPGHLLSSLSSGSPSQLQVSAEMPLPPGTAPNSTATVSPTFLFLAPTDWFVSWHIGLWHQSWCFLGAGRASDSFAAGHAGEPKPSTQWTLSGCSADLWGAGSGGGVRGCTTSSDVCHGRARWSPIWWL